MKYIFSLIIILVVIIPSQVGARVGVGIGTGKIEITEILIPGKKYDIPQLTVINTGDEIFDYGVGISYHEKQPEMMPPESWFLFSPATFTLEPGQSQAVSIELHIPIRVVPGNYFAYIEGHPIHSDSSQTKINIAAATKFYFQVGTSNTVASIYYKMTSLWDTYSPWTNRITIAIVIILIIFICKKFVKIQVDIKK